MSYVVDDALWSRRLEHKLPDMDVSNPSRCCRVCMCPRVCVCWRLKYMLPHRNLDCTLDRCNPSFTLEPLVHSPACETSCAVVRCKHKVSARFGIGGASDRHPPLPLRGVAGTTDRSRRRLSRAGAAGSASGSRRRAARGGAPLDALFARRCIDPVRPMWDPRVPH